MRALITVTIAFSLLAILAPDAFAAPRKRHPRTHAPYASPYVGPKPGFRTDGWYEHDSNRDQMGREGRARQ